MTPLAYAVAKQTTLKPRKRKPLYLADEKRDGHHADLVADIHCFECSAVFDIACDMVDAGQVREALGEKERFFLPAPKTWIECKTEDGRAGWLLTEDPFTLSFILDQDDRFVVSSYDLFDDASPDMQMTGLVLGMLLLINSPHVVERERFKPHRELARLWAKRDRAAPLNAWHELKLSISKPIEIDDGEPHAEHIGGRRARHFCRAHLRVRMGRLEFVTSHWRGDAALGTKLARYRVAP